MKEVLITSSVMILAVMILRFLFRTKVNRRLVYGVWLLVALRLLVPIQFGQLDFSVLTQAKPVTDAITDIAQRPVSGPSREELYQDALRQEISQGAPVFIPEVQDRVDTEIQQSGRPAPEVYEEFLETNRSEEILLPEVSQKIEVAVTEKAAPNWGQIALWVWLAGSFGMAGWFLGVNISLRRSLRRSATDFAAECPIPVKVSAAVSSPCLFGLLRPTIYLTPACTEDEQRLRHVLTHEQTHLRHGDHIWAWVRCLCLCIYWFNPLVWAAAYLSKRDCELACDEAALKTLGEEERLAYGKTLVDMVASHPAPGQLLETATAMHETKKQLKERVNRIVKKPKVFLTAAIALLLVLTIVTGCAFTGALTDPTSSNSTTPTDGTQPSTPTEGHEIIESTIHVDQQAVLPLIEALLNKNSDSISIVSFEYDRQGNCAILYRDTAASTDNDFYLMRLAHTSEGFRVITDTPYINTLPAYTFEFSEITSTAEWPDVLTAEALVSPRYGISATIPITDMTVNVSVPMVLPISEGAASINESIQKTYNAKLREIKRCIDDPYGQITNILIDYDAHIGKDVLFIRVTHYRQSATKTELTPYDRYYYYLDLLNGEQLELIDILFRDGWELTDPTDPTTTPTEPPVTDEVAKFQTLLISPGYDRNPYRSALSCEFSDPTELSLMHYFKDGFRDEWTATEAELAELRQHYSETYVSNAKYFYRLPKDKMDAELQKYFGISLADLPDRAFSGLIYLESSDSYCYIDTWRDPYVKSYTVQRVEHMSDGTVRVEYAINSSEKKNVLTLKPNGEDYLILSNDHNVIDDPEMAMYHALFEHDVWERNPYVYATGHEYSSPHELKLKAFYDGGFEGEHELTDAEYAELKALAKYPDIFGLVGDFNRLPKDKMNAELQAVFGISLADLPDSAFEGLTYLKSTDCYYFSQSAPTSTPRISNFLSIEHNDDGTVTLGYDHTFDNTIKRKITLKPYGDGYLVLSNVNAEN